MAKIYINPGHGGNDSGAVGIGGRKEKTDNLLYASQVATLLRGLGHTVKLQRDNDTYISVTNIARYANDWEADLFVSFHRNAYNGTAKGAETLTCSSSSNTSRKMAQAIQDVLVGVGFSNRGVKIQDKNTYVLQATHMPACTIEAGFIDSSIDNNIFDSKFDEMCVGIANAISTIAGGAVQPAPVVPPSTGGTYEWQIGFDEYPMRDAPNDNAIIIKYLKPDDEVNLESYYNGDEYARIKTKDDIVGYVKFDYISKQ